MGMARRLTDVELSQQTIVSPVLFTFVTYSSRAVELSCCDRSGSIVPDGPRRDTPESRRLLCLRTE